MLSRTDTIVGESSLADAPAADSAAAAAASEAAAEAAAATAVAAAASIAALASGAIRIGDGSGVATARILSGDVTVNNTGVTAIGAGKVTNAMLAGSIAYGKLSLTGAILNADLAGSIDLTAKVAGLLPAANGGTGVVPLSRYATLALAIAGIGSTVTTLLIDRDETVSADATIPATLSLMALPAYKLTIATTKTLTINGPIAVPSGQQVFLCSGTGRVALDASLGHAMCDVTWFGAKPNATNSDDGPYINNAIASRADWVICTGQFNLQTAIDFTPWSTVGDAADAMKTFSGLGARFVQNANLTSMVNLSPTDGGQLFRKRIQIGRLLGVKASYTLTQAVYHRCCSNCIIELDAIENGGGIGYHIDQTSTPAFISGNNSIRTNRLGGHTGDGFRAAADTSGVVGVEGNIVDVAESGFNGGMGAQLGTALNQRVMNNAFRFGAVDGNTGRGVYFSGGGNVCDIGVAVGNGTADVDCLTGITLRNRIRTDATSALGTTLLREHGVNGQPATYRDTTNVSTAADTNETTLQTYTIPASTLKPGMRVRLTAWGSTGATANVKTLRMYFGSAVVWTTGGAFNGVAWRAEADIEIKASNSQEYHSGGGINGVAPAIVDNTSTETDTNAIVVKITGQNGTAAANDVVGQGFRVDIIG